MRIFAESTVNFTRKVFQECVDFVRRENQQHGFRPYLAARMLIAGVVALGSSHQTAETQGDHNREATVGQGIQGVSYAILRALQIKAEKSDTSLVIYGSNQYMATESAGGCFHPHVDGSISDFVRSNGRGVWRLVKAMVKNDGKDKVFPILRNQLTFREVLGFSKFFLQHQREQDQNLNKLQANFTDVFHDMMEVIFNDQLKLRTSTVIYCESKESRDQYALEDLARYPHKKIEAGNGEKALQTVGGPNVWDLHVRLLRMAESLDVQVEDAMVTGIQREGNHFQIEAADSQTAKRVELCGGYNNPKLVELVDIQLEEKIGEDPNGFPIERPKELTESSDTQRLGGYQKVYQLTLPKDQFLAHKDTLTQINLKDGHMHHVVPREFNEITIDDKAYVQIIVAGTYGWIVGDVEQSQADVFGEELDRFVHRCYDHIPDLNIESSNGKVCAGRPQTNAQTVESETLYPGLTVHRNGGTGGLTRIPGHQFMQFFNALPIEKKDAIQAAVSEGARVQLEFARGQRPLTEQPPLITEAQSREIAEAVINVLFGDDSQVLRHARTIYQNENMAPMMNVKA